MPTWKQREVRAALEAKGFVQDRSTDHYYYVLFHGDQATSIRTKVSFSKKTVLSSRSGTLFNKFKRQLRLTGPQLTNFLNCPLTSARYVEILAENNEIQIETDTDSPDES